MIGLIIFFSTSLCSVVLSMVSLLIYPIILRIMHAKGRQTSVRSRSLSVRVHTSPAQPMAVQFLRIRPNPRSIERLRSVHMYNFNIADTQTKYHTLPFIIHYERRAELKVSMSNSNAGGSTLPNDPMLQRVDATAIAEAKAPSVASANPNRFMNTTQLGSGLGIGPTMNLSMNPLFLQQEMIRRQELERTLGGTAPIAGLAYGLNGLDAIRRREEYLLQLRNNQIIEAELVVRRY